MFLFELKYTASDMKYLGFSEKCLKFYQWVHTAYKCTLQFPGRVGIQF